MDSVDALVLEPPGVDCVLAYTGLPGGGSTIQDRSHCGNKGSIVGAVWARLTSGLSCLSFDGVDDLVNCGNGAGLQMDGELTIELWYRPMGDASAANSHIAGRSKTRVYQPIASSPTVLQAYIRTDQGQLWIGFDALTLNEWQHLALTYDGSLATGNCKVYRNGSMGSSGDRQGTLSNPADNWYLGGGITGQVNGMIALFRVHSRALTAPEIWGHFHREKHLFGPW